MTETHVTGRARVRLSFRWIALAFVVLLGLGFGLAVVVYQRFVAYRAVAAHHVPADATAFARFDLTHVMLYEPFRRSVFPLADVFGPGRRERLRAEGLELGAEVREVVVALGPTSADWSVALGGPLVDHEVASTLARVLRGEGRRVDERGGAYFVDGGTLAFAQADDGALLFAPSEVRLRKALVAAPPPDVLTENAGGLRVTAARLHAGVERLDATYRTGSVIQIRLEAHAGAGAHADRPGLGLRLALATIGDLDPLLAEATKNAVIEDLPGGATSEVTLTSAAAERLAERLAERVAAGLGFGPGTAPTGRPELASPDRP